MSPGSVLAWFLLFRRRNRNAPAAAAAAITPMATPTPMPAFAPVDTPLLAGVAEAVANTVVDVEAVGVETDTLDVPVAVVVVRPRVDCWRIQC